MSSSLKYPFCDSVEDTLHVQKCQSTTTSNHQKTVLDLPPKKLDRLHTSLIVKLALLQTLVKLWKETPIQQGQPISGSILQLQEGQQQLGPLWNLVNGKWCLRW